MKQKLLIIGAGNVGGFIAYNIEELGNFDVLGFLDDDVNKHGLVLYDHKVLGPVALIEELSKEDKLAVVVSVANPTVKKRIAQYIEGLNIDTPNFIAKNVWISKNVSLGKGVILYPGVSINYETVIEDFVVVNMNCAIGHNCIVSKYSSLAPGVNLAGFTAIAPGADVGIGAATRQGMQIGAGAVIGGQSMVVKNVKENSKVKGVPAQEF